MEIRVSVLDLRTATELAVPVASFNLLEDKSQYRMECVPSVASPKGVTSPENETQFGIWARTHRL